MSFAAVLRGIMAAAELVSDVSDAIDTLKRNREARAEAKQARLQPARDEMSRRATEAARNAGHEHKR